MKLGSWSICACCIFAVLPCSHCDTQTLGRSWFTPSRISVEHSTAGCNLMLLPPAWLVVQ